MMALSIRRPASTIPSTARSPIHILRHSAGHLIPRNEDRRNVATRPTHAPRRGVGNPFPRTVLSIPGAVLLLLFTACDSAESEPDPVPLSAEMVEDIAADPTTTPPQGGQPISTGRFTLYSLGDKQVVLPSTEADPAVRAQDSSSTAWDLGFQGTTIILNGGTSGPGTGAAQILSEAFDDVMEAPAGSYAADGRNTCPAVNTPSGEFPGVPLAICTGSGNGWYTYNPQTNHILPIPGRTIVLRTADGKYAKMRILSYYKGRPDQPSSDTPSRYYTFEYILQPDGSRNFETTIPE